MIDVQKQMTRAAVAVLRDNPFYGHIMCQMAKVFGDEVPTMAVAKRERDFFFTLFVNPGYVSSVYEKHGADKGFAHVCEVLKHEMLHLVFEHVMIGNPDRTVQLACELSVNSYINRRNLVDKGVFPEDFGLPPCKGWRWYLDELTRDDKARNWCKARNGQEENRNGQGAGNGADGNGQDGQNDARDAQDGHEESRAGQNAQGGSQRGQDDSGNGDGQNCQGSQNTFGKPRIGSNGRPVPIPMPVKGKGMARMQSPLQKPQGRNGGNQSGQNTQNGCPDGDLLDCHAQWGCPKDEAAMAEVLLKDVIRKAREETMAEGKWGEMPGSVRESVEAALEPEERKICWESLIRDFVASSSESVLDYTNRRESRRYGTRPGVRLSDKVNLAVGIDTSGSIDKEALRMFYDELYWLSKNDVDITVFEADCKIQREYPFGDLDIDEVKGGGGTDLEPVIKEAAERKFDALVYFTDGFASKIEERYGMPVAFVVSEGSWHLKREELPYEAAMVFYVRKDGEVAVE